MDIKAVLTSMGIKGYKKTPLNNCTNCKNSKLGRDNKKRYCTKVMELCGVPFILFVSRFASCSYYILNMDKVMDRLNMLLTSDKKNNEGA